MRSIMAKRNSLVDLETANNDNPESAQTVIPAGVQADVTVKYRTLADPALQSARARPYNDELEELARLAEEDTARPVELPFDPITQFCAEWRNYAGWLLKVTRLPDPATRRMAGQSYNRTCLEIESLGSIPFDPANLEGILQIINGNSGGVFRVWLVDQNGQPVQDAFLDRVAVGDPPRQFGREHRPAYAYDLDSNYPNAYFGGRIDRQQTSPAPPQKSAMEERMETLQAQLFEKAILRAMEPPNAPAPATTGISDEDRVGLLLLNQGGLLPALMTKLTALAQSPETITKEQSWKERAIDATFQLAQNNPAIVERLSGTLERIINRVLPDPRAPVNVAANLQPSQQSPQPQLAHNSQSEIRNPKFFAPDGPNPDAPDTNPDPDDDEDIVDIVESLFELLSDTRPFSVNDPVFTELREAYPQKFAGAMQMIANVPIDAVIEWIKTRSSLYEAMLDGPVTGPHYRARLAELQAFCRAPGPSPAIAIEQPDNEQPNETETDTDPAAP